MLYLLLAIASSAMVSVCMRVSEKYVRNTMAMFTANYAVCLAVSWFHVGNRHILTLENGIGKAAALGVISGFLYLVCFILLQQNIRCNGVVLASASMKLGSVLIPVMAAALFFRERMGWVQLAGVALAAAAILLINIEKGDVSKGGRKSWLVVLLAVSGLTDTMANIYDKTGTPALKNHYLFYTFLAALFLAFAVALLKREKAALPDICCGLLIGIPNYYSARFILLALGRVPAIIVYPAYSVGKASTVFTSNKTFSQWNEVFADVTIASAILDRVLHHCTVINIKGESYRLKERKEFMRQKQLIVNSLFQQGNA